MWLLDRGRAQLLLLTICIAASLTNSERSDAFVGYSEDASSSAQARCQDKEDGCAVWYKAGECLTNPYYMRFNCARSCQIPSCDGYKHRATSWKGYATEYHTKQYTTRSAACPWVPLNNGFQAFSSQQQSYLNLMSGHSPHT